MTAQRRETCLDHLRQDPEIDVFNGKMGLALAPQIEGKEQQEADTLADNVGQGRAAYAQLADKDEDRRYRCRGSVQERRSQIGDDNAKVSQPGSSENAGSGCCFLLREEVGMMVRLSLIGRTRQAVRLGGRGVCRSWESSSLEPRSRT